MPHAYKVLGQAQPGGGVLATLYTVPGARSAVVSSIVVCNPWPSPSTFRVSVAVAGAADAMTQYLYYDTPISPNDTLSLTLGVTLATTDVVRVQSASGQIVFNAFGDEVS